MIFKNPSIIKSFKGEKVQRRLPCYLYNIKDNFYITLTRNWLVTSKNRKDEVIGESQRIESEGLIIRSDNLSYYCNRPTTNSNNDKADCIETAFSFT